MKLRVSYYLITSLLCVVAYAAPQLQAQTYTLGFDQEQYVVAPGDSVSLTLVLTEETGTGQTARLAAGGDNGLFGFGLGLNFSTVSGGSNGSTFRSLMVDPTFAQDGTTNIGTTDVSFEASEDVIANTDGEFGVGGQMTSANTYEIDLGTVTFVAGDLGTNTTVQAIDHVVSTANVFLFADGEQPTINYSSTEILVSDGVLKGDVDLSGVIDFADIPAFILVLQAGVFQAEADCSCNEVVDFGDIPAFIAILQSQ